jgi:outer membrane receptor protein involved in Fe transport
LLVQRRLFPVPPPYLPAAEAACAPWRQQKTRIFRLQLKIVARNTAFRKAGARAGQAEVRAFRLGKTTHIQGAEMRVRFLSKAIADYFRAIPAVLAMGIVLPMQAVAASREPEPLADLTRLSIEELLDVEVYSASKFVQKITEAPSAVTIITAADIKTYGYRTLADVLRSVRGMDVSYDRTYSYLGVRGSGRAGDYNSRVLLLLDGFRLNDPVYDQASIGTEGVVDVDLIERIEIVRGPGSSIYGSNAVLGVINIITKRGRDLDGLEVSGELASFGTDKERVSYGKRHENGAELLL